MMAALGPGDRVNLLGIVVNLGLAVCKLGIGTAAGSAALFADGMNSAGDVVATAIAAAGHRLARAPADANHPWGHGNVESLAGLAVGAMLLATGGFIAIDGLRWLWRGSPEPPEILALWVSIGVAVVKEALYRITVRTGRRLNAPSLLASARDHRADVVIAITVAAGIAAARTGWAWLDPLAAVGVGLWIIGMSWSPIRENLGVLLDEHDEGVGLAARDVAATTEGVRRVDEVRVHTLGAYHAIYLEISVDPDLSLLAAHTIAHAAGERVRSAVPHVREVKVHVNPFGLGTTPAAD